MVFYQHTMRSVFSKIIENWKHSLYMMTLRVLDPNSYASSRNSAYSYVHYVNEPYSLILIGMIELGTRNIPGRTEERFEYIVHRTSMILMMLRTNAAPAMVPFDFLLD